MCEPVTASLAIASMVAGVAGSAMSGYSQYQSAQYNAAVARNNETIAKQNANISLTQGTQQEENQRLKTGSKINAALAQQAASGINPNSGSALDVRTSAAQLGELDALTIRQNYNQKNLDYTNQANAYASQASLDEAQGNWGVASSILGGASSVSDKWLNYQTKGVFGNSGYTGNAGSNWDLDNMSGNYTY